MSGLDQVMNRLNRIMYFMEHRDHLNLPDHLDHQSFMDHLDHLVLLEQRGNREAEMTRSLEEEEMASPDSNQIVSHVGGSLKINDQIIEQSQPTVKIDFSFPLIVPDPILEMVGCEKVADEEDWVDSFGNQGNLFQEESLGEQKESKKKKRKKKRWKKRLGKNLSGEEKEKITVSCHKKWFGFAYVVSKEAMQQEVKKETDAEMDNLTHHVFDKMIMGGKRETRKRKKRKFTKSKRSKYTYGEINPNTLHIRNIKSRYQTVSELKWCKNTRNRAKLEHERERIKHK